MAAIKVAVLGFGTVGQGVYEAIETHQTKLERLLGSKVDIAGVLIQDKKKKRHIENNLFFTTEIEDILQIPDLEVVFEAIVGDQSSYQYAKKAIASGCHVITANKAMFAKHGEKLIEKANEAGVSIGYEATTAGGIPIIRTIKQLLQVNRINKLEAILNGTSNFILTEMRQNKLSFGEALKLAKKIGYAEADPSNDIDGTDAFYKLMILSKLIFGKQPQWVQVEKQGIDLLTAEDIVVATNKGLRYKHIAKLGIEGEQLVASVKPVLVNDQHPLFHVEGVDNAITLQTSLIGELTLQGPGAGKLPTASAMIEDFIDILQRELREQTEQAVNV